MSSDGPTFLVVVHHPDGEESDRAEGPFLRRDGRGTLWAAWTLTLQAFGTWLRQAPCPQDSRASGCLSL